jgi:uncharacterized membrane protein YfcA
MELAAWNDPATAAALLGAAALVGLAKGGLGGLGVMAVPVLALALPPVQAAAILLPILCVTDLVALRAWWGSWCRQSLRLLLPGALAGIGVGWLTAAAVSDDVVRLIVGAVALGFVASWVVTLRPGRAARPAPAPRPGSAARATFWGGLAGYTSFVAHAGGPPFAVYVLPLGLDPRRFTGTAVAFFALVNYVKLVPYFALGQLDATNLATALWLLPVAVAFTLLGALVIRRMRAEVFYPLTYALTALVGLRLVWDGLAGP